MKREIQFSAEAFSELKDWVSTNHKIASKILELLHECARTPFEGKGKPEGLKNNLKGYWSRRITDEHRLVYRVTETTVYVLSCKGHYQQ